MHHGSSGTGEQFLHTSGWREKADAEGLIAVFPTGAVYFVLDRSRYSTKWNDFTLAADVDTTLKPIGYPLTAPWPADDVRFENTILDDLEALLPVDQSRVYAAGFSNGGGFTSRLAVEVSNRFAAAGAMAGALGQEYVPVERIPVIYGLGTLDDRVLEQVNPALLALGRDTITALPLDPDSLLDLPQVPTVFAAIANTFDLEPDVYTVRSDGTTNTIFGWTTPQAGNTDGNVFYFGLLAGVTHQYPRGPLGPHGSNNPNNFDATEVFWPFFRAHPKN
jgi:polyhydroxybutyrate depolymerase